MPDTDTKPKYERKQVMVNRKLQMKLIFQALIPMFIFVVIIAIGLLFAFNYIESEFHFESFNDLMTTLSSRIGADINSQDLFNNIRIYAFGGMALIFLVFVAYMFYVLLFLSHRIAGPVHHFEKTFERVLDGNLDVQIKLREKDEFKETAEHFNVMIKTLQDRVKRLDQFNRFSREAIAEMKENASEENKTHFEKIEDLNRSIEELIHEFRF